LEDEGPSEKQGQVKGGTYPCSDIETEEQPIATPTYFAVELGPGLGQKE